MSERNEISKKNPYWIEKHRYLELKHFCLQYPIWKAARNSIDGLSKSPDLEMIFSKSGIISDPTARCAMQIEEYNKKMNMIKKAAHDACYPDTILWIYILDGVTKGKSYECLNAEHNIPCCKDKYYEIYRKFFYILNHYRN